MSVLLLFVLVGSAIMIWVKLRQSGLLHDDTEARFSAAMVGEIAAAKAARAAAEAKSDVDIAVAFDRVVHLDAPRLAGRLCSAWGLAATCVRVDGDFEARNGRVRVRIEVESAGGRRIDTGTAFALRRGAARLAFASGGDSARERARFAAQTLLAVLDEPGALGVVTPDGAARQRAELDPYASLDVLDAAAVTAVLGKDLDAPT